MALVITDEIDIEAQRILDAADHFAALGIKPANCTVKDVLDAYDGINTILKRREAIRNPKAAKARARIDLAKAQLSNEKQLNIEKSKYRANFVSNSIPSEQATVLNLILNTTEMLERRVDAMQQKKKAAAAAAEAEAAASATDNASPVIAVEGTLTSP